MHKINLPVKAAKYLAVAKIAYSTATAYLMNLFGSGVVVLVRSWIFVQLYAVTYASVGAEEIGGLTVAMAVWSLMLTQSFQAAARPYPSILIEEEVKSGTLAYSVSRPYSYILYHYFTFLGRAVPNVVINIGMGIVVMMILIGGIPLTWPGLLFGILLLYFGFTVEFFMSFIIGLLAFWIEDVSSLRWIYSKGQLVFGGLILPLALFPEKIRGIAELLPFAQLYYVPARLFVNFDYLLMQRFVVTQLIWLAIFGILSHYLYQKGVKHVSINGG